MKVRTETKRTVTIVLDEEEAFWLKGLIQNSLDLSKEPGQLTNFRRNLFNNLPAWPGDFQTESVTPERHKPLPCRDAFP